MKIFTIGYSPLSMTKVIRLLRSESIGLLIDVRINNEFGVKAGFSCSEITDALPRDITYEHVRDAGNPFRPPQYLGTFERLMKSYRGAIQRNGAYRIVAQLVWQQMLEGKSTCLMCACKNSDQCHRSVLAELVKDELNDYCLDPITITDLPRLAPEQSSLFEN